jgi:flagellin
MSSILTNNSAMVALDTLRNINKDMSMVQNEIATGKSVSSAKDNAAVWSISTVMSSDVESFKQIKDSLNLGSSTVGVARSAAEQVTERLTDMKALIVSAQEENVDRTKIQADITALTEEIGSIVGAAQFNGQNLIDGTSTDDMKILSSLDRSSGGVTPSTIDVKRQDLSLTGTVTPASLGVGTNTDQTIIANGAANSGTAATVTTGNTQNIEIASVASGNGYTLELSDLAGANELGTQSFEYVASASDSAADVAQNLFDQLDSAFQGTNYSVSEANGVLSITNSSGDDVSIEATATTDVTSDAGGALNAIDGLIDTAIDAAASFGSGQTRIENQGEFVQSLVDSMTTGIGGLVDADMEATSAKLQALQVQQQLGTQALSIANQAPQSLLSLFR